MWILVLLQINGSTHLNVHLFVMLLDILKANLLYLICSTNNNTISVNKFDLLDKTWKYIKNRITFINPLQ